MRDKNNNHNRQGGSVLLTTLLVMAVMAALAVAIIEDIRFAVKRTVNGQTYAQADWYVVGAREFAGQYLSQLTHDLSAEAINTALTRKNSIVFPLEHGRITFAIRDGSHCFSLGALVTAAGAAYTPGQRRFAQLLRALEWSEAEANRLAAIAVDWADKDGQTLQNGAEDFPYLGRTPVHRTANTAFVSAVELRALEAMSEDRFQQLLPFVCARRAGEITRININTLHVGHAPLLAAMLGDAEVIEVARRLIAERPQGGYVGKEQLRAAPALEGLSLKNAAFDQILFQPNRYWIEAKIEVEGRERYAAYGFELNQNGGATLTHSGLGEDALRPALAEPVL